MQLRILLLCIALTVRCAGSPPPYHHRATGVFLKPILLKTSNDTYVRLNSQPPFFLIADTKVKALADTFHFCDLNNNAIALEAREQYVSIYLANKNQAILRQTYIGSWEQLQLEKKENYVCFRAVNDLYVNHANNDHILVAQSRIPSDSCHFIIVEL